MIFFRKEDCVGEDINDVLSDAEVGDAPNVKWEDILGIQQAVDKIQEYVLLPAKYPQMLTDVRKPGCCGLLLYGPPGTGKTLLVQATIAELLSHSTLCYNFSVYDLLSRLLKNPIQALRAMFKKAQGFKQSAFFIDDIEVLSQQCEGETDMATCLRTELLQQISYLRTNCNECKCTFVGITNKPWKLANDPSLRQVFEVRVYSPLPESEARSAIFKQQFRAVDHTLSEQQFRLLAERSEGFSGSDIVVVARDACMEPVRKIQTATHFKHIFGPSAKDSVMTSDHLTPCSADDVGAIEMTWSKIEENQLFAPAVNVDDVMKTLTRMKRSVSKEELDMYKKFIDEWSVT